MERSTAHLTYKGSISEAIIESQKQKKLFLVFISGNDEDSTNLENSTWLDDRVASAISRYCIFLHLIHERIEASHFSAIYPQKSVPSISAVGYNGVMLWQHEGYINGENFVENIEKAWAAMHFQDTAVVLLSAALASKKSEPSNSGSTDADAVVEGGSSNLIHHPLSENLVKQQGEDIGEHDNPIQFDTANAEIISLVDSENNENETSEISHSSTQKMPKVEALQEELQSNESQSLQINANGAHEETQSVPNEKDDRENTATSTTIHLSIRMPGGVSLQEKFAGTDILRSVKNYVDDNCDNSLGGSYDLAIPYPRKVFGEEDMCKALSELEFAGRQALIVIPKRTASAQQRGVLSSNDVQFAVNQTSNDDSIGYFGYLKRAFSYFNPFSYFGGSGGGSDFEGPNPGPLNSSSNSSSFRHPYSPNPPSSNAGTLRSRTASRPFGSNIHTLRQEEDDSSSRDQNTFWNGNSTQYGGNDK